MKKTIGIIGGMGPLATCDLFKKIINETYATSDQEHIRVVIDNNTEIPDRTMAILHGGMSPVKEMVKSAVLLSGMGASLLIMPCNTAHFFYDEIVKFIDIPLLHMIKETSYEVINKGIKKVALLATDGTVKSNVYKKVFDEKNIEMLLPNDEEQKNVMDIIYKGVKAGNMSFDINPFLNVIDRLLNSGAETLILGCTELPVAFDIFKIDRPHIDPTLVLARAAIKKVGGKLKNN